MYRIDRLRLAEAEYSILIEVATRFDDLDVQGHVNNVAVAVLLQEGRARFNQQVMRPFLDAGGGMVVGNIVIDYAASLFAPEPVEISTGVLEIGRSSYGIGQIVRQEGKIAVYAETTVVTMERGKGPTPLGDAARAMLEAARI